MTIPRFTREQYLNTSEPYEYLYRFVNDRFTLEQKLSLMSEDAKALRVRNFISLYRQYEKSKRKAEITPYTNSTNFDGQELDLFAGEWEANDYGVMKMTQFGEAVACVHPIMPVMRLVNIDSGIEKMKIAFRKGNAWRSTIEDKKVLASWNGIIELANKGVAVTSENSKYLVSYLSDVENLNYERIPENKSVGRLGWIDGEGFSPYVDDLIYDGDLNFRTFFESVSEKGAYAKWKDAVMKVRKGGVHGRVILAASFSSVLLKPLNLLPFFLHLWGSSGTGKTVGLMLAASVWANPEAGRFIHTFNSTAVGREKSASFVNSLPLILDEMQILEEKSQFDKDIYMLSEGAGRTRGTKTGGLEKVGTWRNCIITSGEAPMTNHASGSGALNRIIELECKEQLFGDPRELAAVLMNDYGFAGRLFVDRLTEGDSQAEAKQLFDGFYAELSKRDTTDKQAHSLSAILAADSLIEKWLFCDGVRLTVDDLIPFAKTKKAVSVNERAYEYLCDYVIVNKYKFQSDNKFAENWGAFDPVKETVYIVNTWFNKICREEGYEPRPLLSWLRDTGKIDCGIKGFTKTKKINGSPANCVWLRLPGETDGDFIELEDCVKTPFDRKV